MKFDKYFIKYLLIISLISLKLSAIILFYFNNGLITRALIAGFFLATLNVSLGYISIEYAYNKSMAKFMKVLIGGMGIRMVILISCLLLFLNIIKLHTIALISSLFVFYVIFLIFEIIYIEKRLKSRIS